MTKAKMIETLQQKEAYAWYKLQEHEYNNAPRNGDAESWLYWDCHDNDHLKLLYAWSELNELIEAFGIDVDYENGYRKLAFEYINELSNIRINARKNENK